MAYYATYMPNELGELQKVVINAGVGFVLPYYGETAPPGTLACDGSEISREAYKELFQVLGTKAGAGDGSTTFNLPDFRGDFIRCVGGNAAELGVEQEDAIRDIQGSFLIRSSDIGSLGSSFLSITDGGGAFSFEAAYSNETTASFYTQSRYLGAQKMNFDAGSVVPTAVENRPINVALLWCIIYE